MGRQDRASERDEPRDDEPDRAMLALFVIIFLACIAGFATLVELLRAGAWR